MSQLPDPSVPPPALPQHESTRLGDTGLRDIASVHEELERIKAHLQRSERLTTLGTLTAMVAHEFNNILTPLISYAEMALARPDDIVLLRKAAEKSLQSGLRASELASSVLGFAHARSESPHCDPAEAVAQAIRCMAREPEKEGIDIHIDVPSARVAMPAVHLQHVVLNLLINATRALRGRAGGQSGGQFDPAIRITGQVEAEVYRLEIADNGPGIPAELQDKLFQAFVAASPSTRVASKHHDPIFGDSSPSQESPPIAPDEGSGSGLGLAVCRSLVERSGGTIAVGPESFATGDGGGPVNTGAVFLLDIPLSI